MGINFPSSPAAGQKYLGYVFDGMAWMVSPPPASNTQLVKKNYIINSAMMVSQENGATAGSTAGYYPVDQFEIQFAMGGVLSVAQVASLTPAGSPNRTRVAVTTADAAVATTDSIYLRQKIEGFRAADLKFGIASAKSITIRFGVKAPAGTYSFAIWNGAFTRYYIAEYVIAAGEANTDVVKSVTIPGDVTGAWATDNTTGLMLFWPLMAGTIQQGTVGSWQALSAGNPMASPNQFNFAGTAGNVFELFDVGLYEGATAPAFVVPDYASELRACMRYWEKSMPTDVAPGAANSMCIADLIVGTASTANLGMSVPYKVNKRTAATVVVYDLTGAAGKIYRGANGQTAVMSGLGNASFICYSQTGPSAFEVAFNWTANARL